MLRSDALQQGRSLNQHSNSDQSLSQHLVRDRSENAPGFEQLRSKTKTRSAICPKTYANSCGVHRSGALPPRTPSARVRMSSPTRSPSISPHPQPRSLSLRTEDRGHVRTALSRLHCVCSAALPTFAPLVNADNFIPYVSYQRVHAGEETRERTSRSHSLRLFIPIGQARKQGAIRPSPRTQRESRERSLCSQQIRTYPNRRNHANESA